VERTPGPVGRSQESLLPTKDDVVAVSVERGRCYALVYADKVGRPGNCPGQPTARAGSR